MKNAFRTSQYSLLPSWLTNGEGELLAYSLGLVMDCWMERLRLGIKARFPEYAPDDALNALGRDRKIIRGINEPRAAYAARLLRWLDDHKVRGTPFALMEQIRAYCQADVMVRTVDRRGNWFTIDRDGVRAYSLNAANWDWDGGSLANWARFWLIIYPTAEGLPWTRVENWGTWPWGNATKSIGLSADLDQIASVRQILKDWKPAGTVCEWVIVAYDDASFSPAGSTAPGGNWGTWGIDNAGTYEPVRLDTARYFKGTP